MKEFFKFMFASLLGSLIAIVIAVLGIFFIFIIFISVLSLEESVAISSNTVLEIELNYDVPERSDYTSTRDFIDALPKIKKTLGLNDIIKNINKAKTDNNIIGIYLDLDNIYVGSYAKIEPIRKALKDFKESGKFIVSHGNEISQRAYYLASISDKIFLTPSGTFDFRGLAIEMTFFKKTLEKLDVEAQIFKSGKYKSAVEPFESDKMSDANREQLSQLVNSIYDNMLVNIGDQRNIPINDLKNSASDLSIRNPLTAYERNFVDSLIYYDDVVVEMKNIAGIPNDKSLKKISINRYTKVPAEKSEYSSNRIAVIYALGEIHEGKGNNQSIGMENIAYEIRRAKENSKVKAIILRINSPGGSSLTSDIIWRELVLANQVKPVVASLSSVAASGGYYIACGADLIIAEPTTITGSIGVYGILPNTRDFFEGKLGITFDRVKTNSSSDLFSLTRPLTFTEKEMITKEVDRVYERFITRVTEARKMTREETYRIAQGRVWSGVDAKTNGLIDNFGGLDEAIEIAAERAGIKNYRVVEYPEQKQPFEKIIELLYDEAETSFAKIKLGESFSIYEKMQSVINQIGIQARMPFEININ